MGLMYRFFNMILNLKMNKSHLTQWGQYKKIIGEDHTAGGPRSVSWVSIEKESPRLKKGSLFC